MRKVETGVRSRSGGDAVTDETCGALVSEANKHVEIDMSKAKAPTAKEWDFVLSNGDMFATLTFTRAQIRKFFPGAKIRKNRVVLA